MESFEQIDAEGQKEIIGEYGGKDPKVVEKDFWICFVLGKLFEMPNAHPMAFKGGTSLSKAYNLIHRFSEDIDITLDYNKFESDLDLKCDPFAKGTSGSQRRKVSESIQEAVKKYVSNFVKPYFERVISDLPKNRSFSLKIVGNEELRFQYESVFGAGGTGYIEEAVRMEFGGRNRIVPRETIDIRPFLVELDLPHIHYPTARVEVLDPMRTFWEKVTLAHDFCNKADRTTGQALGRDRKSRHWYDLYMMLEDSYEVKAFEVDALGLLQDVVRIKNVFYRSSVSRYEDCLSGKLRLIPNEDFLEKLGKDYEKMKRSGMFEGIAPSFDAVVNRVRNFEKNFNEQNLKNRRP